jgi:hypothetical protein
MLKASLTRMIVLNTQAASNCCVNIVSSHCVLEKTCVPIEDLISVSVPKRQNSPTTHHQVFPVLDATSPSINSSDNLPNEEFDYKSFTINYAKRLIDSQCEQGSATCNNVNKWRVHSITLYNNDKMIVKEWFDTLSRLLNGEEVDNSCPVISQGHLCLLVSF